jgi:hypothetical protein
LSQYYFNLFFCRNLPAGRTPDQFINRRGYNSLNVLVTGGIDRLIYDLVVNAPGSFHDAAVYQMSDIKPYLESRFPRVCLGDAAFAISDVLMVPYSVPQAINDDTMALFNIRHSGARVEMTENIYGIWKKRFPIITHLRTHLPQSMKIIVATAILHNLSVLWGEINVQDLPDHPDLDAVALAPVPHEDVTVEYDELTPDDRRNLGQLTRDQMRDNMEPNPTPRERRRLAGRRF